MRFEDLRQPNLFLADLGPELKLTPETLSAACHSVRRNRETWLAKQQTRTLIDLLSHVGEQWLDPENPIRQVALDEGARELGLSVPILSEGLDKFFKQLTPENLEALIVQDLGDARRLDEFVAAPGEARSGRMSWAHGPALMLHWAAGNVPASILMSLVLGVLVRSAQVVKCASGADLLPRLFAHSLALVEPKLGACIELVSFPRGTVALENALIGAADMVVASGGDEMIASLTERIRRGTRFVGYGHRVSLGFVTREMLSGYSTSRLLRDAARDVAAWDQLGCLSPHVYYVEGGGAMDSEGFAAGLATELERIETSHPRGEIPVEEASEIVARRSVYEMRTTTDPIVERVRVESVFLEAPRKVQLWRSENSTAWTVVHDTVPLFEMSCLNRFIQVKPMDEFSSLFRYIEPVRDRISTVGLGAVNPRYLECAHALARWGVPRVCPIGRMQDPAFTWRHDGRPALGDLVRWTDLET